MRVGLAQINSHLGNFKNNRKKIIEFVERAKERRCDIVVFPELALFGYHPADLLERESIVQDQIKEFEKLNEEIPEDILVFCGMVTENKKSSGKAFHNVAVGLQQGKKPKFFLKELLPTYDVFDDHRHIEPGDVTRNTMKFKGQNILVTVCEDIWGWNIDPASRHRENPLKNIDKDEVDFVVNLSASPFTETKKERRELVVGKTARYFNSPMVYTNMVGAQDELVFDGGSFAVNKRGEVLSQAVHFEEDLVVVNFDRKDNFKVVDREHRDDTSDTIEECRRAITLGIKDFLLKTGLKSVHLGLSGGIDSALVACLAVDALGPDAVTCFALPSQFNADESLTLAQQLAENLGCNFHVMPIGQAYEASLKTIENVFGEFEFGLLHENLQARTRGLLLMSFSNKNNSLLLSTSNKSEIAVGYSTLYGDMCGGLAPIGDLVKSKVVAMCRHYNKEFELIPERIITRPPSAELRPDQKDEDSLPPYEKLDQSVIDLVERYQPAKSKTDKWVLNAMLKTEFKRWQSPPVIKVTDHSFGRGRRWPVAHGAKG